MMMGYFGTIGSIALILDVCLVLLSLWISRVAIRGIGGLIGSAINYMALGIVILGFAHMLATLVHIYFHDFDAIYGGLFHRGVVLIGFLFLGFGFKKIDNVSKQMRTGGV